MTRAFQTCNRLRTSPITKLSSDVETRCILEHNAKKKISKNLKNKENTTRRIFIKLVQLGDCENISVQRSEQRRLIILSQSFT